MLSTLYIRLLPPIYQGRMSVPQVRSPIQGTEGCAGATAVRFTPLHAGASACQPKQHGIPLYEASCLSLLWHIPPFIRIFPFRAGCVMGKRGHIQLCAGHRISGGSQGRKSPPFCLPGRPLFSTRPSRCSRYIILSLCFYPWQGRPYSYNRCDFMLSPDAFWLSPVWFYRCKYRPSRLSLTF